MFDTVIAFISTFKQSMIIGIAKPIEFIIRGTFKLMEVFTKQLGLLIGGLAQRMAMFKIISQDTADNIGGFFQTSGNRLAKAGRDIAKPFADAQSKASKEMEDILTEQALKNQKDQLKFSGIIGKFSIKFGDAIKDAGKVAEKVTAAITGNGTSVSDQFAGLALSGSQEEQRLLNAGKAEKTQQDILKTNRITNKILKQITVW